MLLLLVFLAGGVWGTAVCLRRQVEQHQVEVLQHRLAEGRQLRLHQTREKARKGRRHDGNEAAQRKALDEISRNHHAVSTGLFKITVTGWISDTVPFIHQMPQNVSDPHVQIKCLYSYTIQSNVYS